MAMISAGDRSMRALAARALRHGWSALRRWRWTVPRALLAAALLALAFDLAAARWSLEASPLRFLRDLIRLAEGFGHGLGVALVGLTIAILDPPRRRQLPWVLVGAWGSGLAANGVKLLVARQRPHSWLSANDTGQVFDTFVGLFPLGSLGSEHQSFPSAHTATAVGLAWMLGSVYPRGRWYFATLAVLVGVQRVTADAHFVSDVLVGAAVGWVVGRWCSGRLAARAAV